MGKFDGVLLASDFDNTLLYTEDALRTGAPVPPLLGRDRKALEYFMARGGRFAIATGRALAAFINFADAVPMNAPGVVCNGAAIYDFAKGEYLETAMLDAAARERGQAVLDRTLKETKVVQTMDTLSCQLYLPADFYDRVNKVHNALKAYIGGICPSFSERECSEITTALYEYDARMTTPLMERLLNKPTLPEE